MSLGGRAFWRLLSTVPLYKERLTTEICPGMETLQPLSFQCTIMLTVRNIFFCSHLKVIHCIPACIDSLLLPHWPPLRVRIHFPLSDCAELSLLQLSGPRYLSLSLYDRCSIPWSSLWPVPRGPILLSPCLSHTGETRIGPSTLDVFHQKRKDYNP